MFVCIQDNNYFISYVLSLAKLEDLDQVLLALAEKLEKFLPLVGGPEHAHLLVPLFESLTDIEEVTVRNQACKSCIKILKQLNQIQHKNQIAAFFELFKRMTNEEKGELFYSRVSASLIIVDLYPLLSDLDQNLIREIFMRLCKDELPIVRCNAALQFTALAAYVTSADFLSNDWFQLLKTLLTDESQTIQLVAIECMPQYMILLKKFNSFSLFSNEILPLIKGFVDDSSWKIRQSLMKNFRLIAETLNHPECSLLINDFFNCVLHLLLDVEPEVRTLAIQQVLDFQPIVDKQYYIKELASVFQQLLEDPVNSVRKLLADVLIDLMKRLDAEMISQYLSDLILKLINDEDSQVRIRIINKISIIAEESPSLITRMTEQIKQLFLHNHWRLRKSVMESMVSIVKHMGHDYFHDHYLSYSLILIKDIVNEVRLAACATISEIVIHFYFLSNEYYPILQERILPNFYNIRNEDYLTRITMLTALYGFLKLDVKTLTSNGNNVNNYMQFQIDVFNHIVQTKTDVVPNVRLRVAQVLNLLQAESHMSSFRDQISMVLHELANDKDKDVRYFATHLR